MPRQRRQSRPSCRRRINTIRDNSSAYPPTGVAAVGDNARLMAAISIRQRDSFLSTDGQKVR